MSTELRAINAQYIYTVNDRERVYVNEPNIPKITKSPAHMVTYD